MMRSFANKTNSPLTRRILAGLLALVMLCGLLPASIPTARAAHWSQPYLDQLVEWGVMRGDLEGNLNPQRDITRAEFMAMLNRAFGYDKVGTTPFRDVFPNDWYYEDVGIAYNVGYIQGTTSTTASPRANLTREQAVVSLTRNLMLTEETGEVLGFTDSRSFSDWSRGQIQAAAKAGIITGYDDGTFRPRANITRGEVASMLVKTIGYLIQEPGEVSLGHIYKNVVISTAGVTLKDTIIAGDLYLTGGIGLGEVMLDNVTVLGKIVASGAGEGNQGESSIILRNVRADEMVVDSITNQFVTIQSQGITSIDSTDVRTHAYLQDTTPANYGLRLIRLNGESGTSVQLAGNIKEVIDLTPSSLITMAQGTADKVTMDEHATGAQLQILNGARIKELDLDVATTVSGTGDIDDLTVYASGSTVSQLPNTITIRPGITANVYGETMDTVAASESSADPRLLSGYPLAKNVAPTSADAVFGTNKRGTIYWALTNLSDGSVSDEDLVARPNSSRILASGAITAAASNTDYTAKLSKLVSDGSYYLSAVLVDSRGQHSPVKVAAFTTPDNSTPAFATGYPQTTLVTSDSIQVAVMPTKSCQLYYAVLPKGSTAPTVQNFRAGAISGSLGWGVRDVTKNVIDVFTVNNQSLRELTDYVVYMCLVDADGGLSSRVVNLNVKTVDGTPPVFMVEPQETKIQATSIALTATINEAGTIYWVVVPEGESYPKPLSGTTGTPLLTSDTAKLQVANGMNALKSGNVRANANRAATLNVTGLTAQTAYDLYYVAMDSAGNYSETVKKMTVHTLDTQPPTVSMDFTKTNDQNRPMPDTDLRLIFSESVQGNPSGYTGSETLVFKTAYDQMVAANAAASAANKDDPNYAALQDDAKVKTTYFADLIRDHILLIDADTYNQTAVYERTADREAAAAGGAAYWETIDWVDYRKVVVEIDEGKTVFTFKSGEAVHMSSGGSYFFRISNLTDTSTNHNLMRPNPKDLDKFTTVFAQVNLTNTGLSANPAKRQGTGATPPRIDMSFQMHPMSTGAVADSVYYDVILWSTLSIKYDLYGRVLRDPTADDPNYQVVKSGDALSLIGKSDSLSGMDDAGWVYLGNDTLLTTNNVRNGRSVNALVQDRETFCKLKDLPEGYTYEFAIEITEVNGNTNSASWSQMVRISVDVAAGQESQLRSLAGAIQANWGDPDRADVSPIGNPDNFSVSRQFTDEAVPVFRSGYPNFTDLTDSSATMNIQLDRAGTLYYAIAKVYKNSTGQWMQDLPTLVKNPSASGTLMVLPEEAKAEDKTNDIPANVLDPSLYPTGNSGYYVAPKSGGDAASYVLGGGVADWDTDPTKYALTAPTYLDIYDPQASANANVTYKHQSVGTANTPIHLPDLDPETTYFVYIVLKGASQAQSPVYVFQFTTEKAKRPVITLQYAGQVRVGSTYYQRVTATTVASADTLSYVLVASGSLPALLTKEFKTATYTPPGATGNGSDGRAGFSVLDAMLTSAGAGMGTIFDEYADRVDPTLKQQVTNYIRASGDTSGDMIGAGNISNIIAGRSRDIDFNEGPLADNTQYFCLAVAEHSKGGLAFAAREGVRKQDRVAPELTDVSVSISRWTYAGDDDTRPSNLPASATNISQIPEYGKYYSDYTVSGSITLTFTKAVYFVSTEGSSGGTALPVLLNTGNTGNDPTDGSGVYLHNHLATSGGTNMFKPSMNTKTATRMITLNFTGVRHGDYLTLFSDGVIANFNSATSDGTMTIRYNARNEPTQETDGDQVVTVYNPGFTINWGSRSWIVTNDGTTQTGK